MLAAVHAMSSGAQTLCFAIALIAFIVGAVIGTIAKNHLGALLCGGLAFFTLVFLWNAAAS